MFGRGTSEIDSAPPPPPQTAPPSATISSGGAAAVAVTFGVVTFCTVRMTPFIGCRKAAQDERDRGKEQEMGIDQTGIPLPPNKSQSILATWD